MQKKAEGKKEGAAKKEKDSQKTEAAGMPADEAINKLWVQT